MDLSQIWHHVPSFEISDYHGPYPVAELENARASLIVELAVKHREILERMKPKMGLKGEPNNKNSYNENPPFDHDKMEEKAFSHPSFYGKMLNNAIASSNDDCRDFSVEDQVNRQSKKEIDCSFQKKETFQDSSKSAIKSSGGVKRKDEGIDEDYTRVTMFKKRCYSKNIKVEYAGIPSDVSNLVDQVGQYISKPSRSAPESMTKSTDQNLLNVSTMAQSEKIVTKDVCATLEKLGRSIKKDAININLGNYEPTNTSASLKSKTLETLKSTVVSTDLKNTAESKIITSPTESKQNLTAKQHRDGEGMKDELELVLKCDLCDFTVGSVMENAAMNIHLKQMRHTSASVYKAVKEVHANNSKICAIQQMNYCINEQDWINMSIFVLCPTCWDIFPDIFSCGVHYKYNHGGTAENGIYTLKKPSRHDKIVVDRTRANRCENCLWTFPKASLLNKHWKNQPDHSPVRKVSDPNREFVIFTCLYCNKIVYNKFIFYRTHVLKCHAEKSRNTILALDVKYFDKSLNASSKLKLPPFGQGDCLRTEIGILHSIRMSVGQILGTKKKGLSKRNLRVANSMAQHGY